MKVGENGKLRIKVETNSKKKKETKGEIMWKIAKRRNK